MKESEITLKKFQFALQKRISTETFNDLRTDVSMDCLTNDIVMRLTHRPYGEIIKTIQYPDGWKEALKEAFFNWANKRSVLKKFIAKYPVKYIKYDIAAFYPSITDRESIMTFMQR